MAVQLPRIQRIAPVAQPSMGQLNVQGPNLAGHSTAVGNQVEKIAASQVEYFQKQQENTWDTNALAKANEFEQLINERLEGQNGLKFRQGDPTEFYGVIAEDIEKNYNQVLEKVTNPREKAILKAKLDQVYDRGTIKANTLFGGMYNKYESKVTGDAIELEKRALVEAASLANLDDPNSFAGIDQQIAKIRDIRFNYGRKTGLVQQDENGREVSNESLRLTTAKDLSSALYSSVDALTAAGRIDVADAIMTKYGEWMDPSARKKATKALETSGINRSALRILEATQGMDYDEAIEYIEEQTKKGPNNLEIRRQARLYYTEEDRQRTQATGRQQTVNFDAAAKRVLEMQKTDPGLTETKMMEDEVIRGTFDKMSAKQQQALSKMVNMPKESNVDVKTKMFDVMQTDEGFRGMSFAKFQESSAGLSAKDKSMFEKMWVDANNDSPTEMGRTMKAADSELQKEMIRLRIVKLNNYGKLSEKDNRKFLNARDAMWKAFQEKEFNSQNPATIKQWTQSYAASVKKGEVFTPPTATVTTTTSTTNNTPKGAVPGGTGTTKKGTTAERIKAGTELAKTLGRTPTPKEIDDYLATPKDQ